MVNNLFTLHDRRTIEAHIEWGLTMFDSIPQSAHLVTTRKNLRASWLNKKVLKSTWEANAIEKMSHSLATSRCSTWMDVLIALDYFCPNQEKNVHIHQVLGVNKKIEWMLDCPIPEDLSATRQVSSWWCLVIVSFILVKSG